MKPASCKLCICNSCHKAFILNNFTQESYANIVKDLKTLLNSYKQIKEHFLPLPLCSFCLHKQQENIEAIHALVDSLQTTSGHIKTINSKDISTPNRNLSAERAVIPQTISSHNNLVVHNLLFFLAYRIQYQPPYVTINGQRLGRLSGRYTVSEAENIAGLRYLHNFFYSLRSLINSSLTLQKPIQLKTEAFDHLSDYKDDFSHSFVMLALVGKSLFPSITSEMISRINNLTFSFGSKSKFSPVKYTSDMNVFLAFLKKLQKDLIYTSQ